MKWLIVTIKFLFDFVVHVNLDNALLWLSEPFNDHRSQLIGSRFFCYNSPAAAAREVFKPSTDAESLLGSI